MRHRVHRQSLGVTREHRAAMLANMSASLITHGRIKTTITKAKALRPFIEKIVTKAKKSAAKTEKKDKLHLRRLAMADVRDEAAISLLFDEKVSEFENRPGGYTRIYKLGPRKGDAAEMAQTCQGSPQRRITLRPKRQTAPRGTPFSTVLPVSFTDRGKSAVCGSGLGASACEALSLRSDGSVRA